MAATSTVPLHLSTYMLALRAAKVLTDQDAAPLPEHIGLPLAYLFRTMAAATKRHGAPVSGFDQIRPIAIAILESSNALSPATSGGTSAA